MSPLRFRGARSLRRGAIPLPGLALLLVLAPLLAACGGERPDEGEATGKAAATPDYERMSFPYELDAAQKRALGAFLDAREGWRLVVGAEHTSGGLAPLKRERPDYEPYFVEGDLTGDGQEDFVVAVTNGSGTFRILWFRHAGGAYAPPQPVANVAWLEGAGLFLEEGGLVVRELDGSRVQRYGWNPERRRLEAR